MNKDICVVLIILLSGAILTSNCSYTNLNIKKISPNGLFQSIISQSQEDKANINLSIEDYKTKKVIVSKPNFFRERAWQTFYSDYPNQEWISDRVFTLGMFRARNQVLTKIKIVNDSDIGIQYLELQNSFNIQYIIELKKKELLEIPFFIDQLDPEITKQLWLKVKFINETELTKIIDISEMKNLSFSFRVSEKNIEVLKN